MTIAGYHCGETDKIIAVSNGVGVYPIGWQLGD